MELIIKDGFKKTEVGLIPQDWKIETFEEVSDKRVKNSITGGPFGSNLKTEDYTSDGIQIIQLQNIGDGQFIDKSVVYTSEKKANELKSCNIFSGEIILSKMGDPVARACIMPDKAKRYLMASDGIRFVVDEKRYSKIFAFYYINSKYFRNRAIDISTGSTRQRIGLPDLKSLKFIKPPLEEQKAIATALSDVDALISNLDQLITKKKAIKQGVMQQLLTPPQKGGKRLAGFTGEWVEKKLGDFCKITTGKLDANAMVEDGDYRFYTCARKFSYIDKFAFDTEALLVSGNGANVGYIHYYHGKFNAYQRTYVLDEFSVNIHFIKCLLDKYLSLRIESEKNDGNTPYIKMDTLTEMSLNLPSNKDEQQSIAQILSDMDKEILQLETKKSKYQDIKQGMMQELLTGKTRLV